MRVAIPFDHGIAGERVTLQPSPAPAMVDMEDVALQFFSEPQH